MKGICYHCKEVSDIVNTDLNLCGDCSGLKQYTKKEKVIKPISKRSAKRESEEREYSKLRKQYLAIHEYCEVEGCRCLATEIHHKGGRENDLLLNTDLFMSVCRDHHREITDNSRWAIENGYSIKRNSNQQK